jgi:very-short-patch-repair endonuclease
MSLPRAEVATGEGPAVQVADAALVDTLAILPTAQADSLFAWVVTRKALGAERFAELLGRRLGARGTAKLREVYLKWLVHGAASGFEFDLRGVLEASGLGGFKANAPIAVPGFGTVVADFYYPEAKLIVEADGRGTHAGQAAFEADRARDMALIAAGFKVIRVTWRGLRDNPAKVVQAVAAAVRPEP